MGTLFLLLVITPYAFADDGKPINVNILDSYSQVTLDGTILIDSIKEKNIISSIQDMFTFEYENLDSYVSVSYDANPDFVEKSTSIAMSSGCRTEITSKHSFTVDSTDIDSIFLELIANDRLSKSSLSQSLIFQSDDPENWTITAVTENFETKVQMLHCGERLTEYIASSEKIEILSILGKITGLKDSQISSLWSYENKDLIETIDRQTNEELIEKSEQILADAAANQAKLESTVETITTGEGDVELGVGVGGCLIATATYGTELAPQVQQLREIRNNIVLNTESGESFMSGFNQIYYSFSPTIADWERQNSIFQEVVRVFITPLVSSLSIMTLADDASEVQVLGWGISIIALNIGMYLVAPTLAVFKVRKHFKSRK